MTGTTLFGKKVLKRLVDLEKSQEWLIQQVRERSGGKCFDSRYLSRILRGQSKAETMRKTICEVLGIEQEGE